VRLALAVAAFAAVTVVTYLIAEKRMFLGFQAYDDEGYMLIALKGFVNHGSLYDDVFTQYGPFYYELWGGIFSVFGIPVTHESGRVAALVVWILTGLITGFAAWRMTGSVLLGLAVQMLTFGAVTVVTSEPMHPGGLIMLLLAAILAISCFIGDRESPYAAALLGGAVAALILVKVNVGFFALAALALVCVVTYPALASRRWPRPLVEAGFVALPLLLMTSKLGESWARHYAVHVAIAALAVVIALRARQVQRRPDEELWWLGGGLLVVGLAIFVGILGAGTGPEGLLKGVIGQPLRQADAFSLPLGIANRTYLFDLLALVGALAYWYAARGRRTPSPVWVGLGSSLAILIGAAMALSTIGRSVLFDSLTFSGVELGLLSFAWVALIPVAGEDRATAFARLLLPPLAVLQALHAYPVAGSSQLLWSAFLLIPVGALCVAAGVRGLTGVLTDLRERRALFAVAAVTAVVAMAVLVEIQLRKPLDEARAVYAASVSVGLPGAERIRIAPSDAELYQQVTAAIDRNCASVVMLPGMSSFYLWSEQEPPTWLNATAWPTLFDDPDQRSVIAATRSVDGLCLLRNTGLAESWSGGPIPPGPLVRYLGVGFEPIATFGPYELLRREGVAKA